MTGRGRPRKAEKPEPKSAKSKTTPEEIDQTPRGPRKDLKEDKHNGATKEQKPKRRAQKMPNQTDEKPCAQSTQNEKTTKHVTEETKQRTLANNVKAPVKGRKAKICADRATTTEQSPAEVSALKPETPKNKTEDSPDITKAKKYAGKLKSTEQLDEETTKSIPKDTTKNSLKTKKDKKAGGEAKSPEKFPEDTMKMQPEAHKHITKACAPQTQSEDKASMNTLLITTLENLKIRKNDRSNASKAINQITKNITDHVKQNIDWFKDVEQIPTGSYYENLKISNPDEFDVMLAIPVDRVDIKPFDSDGAFYSVGLKRGNNPLKKFQEDDVLSSSAMLSEFREAVKKCVKAFKEWTVTRKKKGCPAVTLTTTVDSVLISLDVVLCIKVKSSWPPFTADGLQIERWLGAKVKQEHRRKPYYLVPKYEGKGMVKIGGVQAKDAWRISFSHIEKAILMNHGSEKTCCEKEGERCCRKDCLKLLKHLLSRLKEQDSSFDKFYSYQAKTTLLHACCSRTKDSEWRPSQLSHCFLQLLEDFLRHLEKGVLPNFFIPSQNLLAAPGQMKCDSLARRIKEERDKSFPIFR